MKDLLKAIISGIIIVLGVMCYLSIEDKVVGAFIFNIGLVAILTFEFNLYTGKIGYIVCEKISYVKRVLIILLGNFIGAVGTSYLVLMTRYGVKVADKAKLLSDIKLNDDLLSILILAIFCGVFMFLAVDGFKHIKHEIGKYLLIILCIMGFILGGFEHSIADIVYLTLAQTLFTIEGMLVILVALIGNGLGAIIIPLIKKVS